MVRVAIQNTDGRMSPHTTYPAALSSVSRCVVFSVAGRSLALPVESVRRFLPLPRLDRLPTAPSPVEGVFRYHGEIVAVLRLSAVLDLEGGDSGLYAPLILVTWRGRPLALLVDRVRGDVTVPAEALSPAEPSLSFNGCAVAGFADPSMGGAGTVTLLDPDRLLGEAESRMLDAFRDAEARRLGQWDGAHGIGDQP